MRLRTRVFLLVLTAAMVSGLLAYIAIEQVLSGSFLALEQNAVRAEAERARAAVVRYGEARLAGPQETLAAELAVQLKRPVELFGPGHVPPGQVEPVWVELAGERDAWGWFRIDAADGRTLLTGRVGVAREIHAQAREALALIAVIVVLIVLLAPLAAEFVIDRLVVSRVRRVRDWAAGIAAGGALAPPQADGGDEIGELTRSIAGMAAHLNNVQKDVEAAREQADRANRAKSEFLAGASHEIRTPLTAILGYAELLKDRRLSDEEYTSYLNTIRSNGEDLLGILNDILDLSKIEAGRLDLSWEKSDIRAVIVGVLSLLRVKADARGLALELTGDENLPARAFIDPVRFRQIMVNLIGNGIRYTDRGRVSVHCLVDRGNPVNARLFVDVRDTGVGMDASQVAQLFRPFTQLGYGGARRAGGTGLGLALSQEFARAMGGRIAVQSVPGQGSTFTLELPLGDLTGVPLAGTREDPVPEDSAEPDDAELFSGRRVFLVEDNPVNRLLVEKLLQRLDVAVTSEGDGMAALDHLLKSGERYDLVLLDMHLPSLDGYGIVRRLRIANYRGIVVALTASAMAGERERALHAGCDDFIAKPLQTRAFLRTCRDWLRKARMP
ncbi:MAG: ATP-binding protein [Pseudomonadota bacterium]